jgi:hypothetical protein
VHATLRKPFFFPAQLFRCFSAFLDFFFNFFFGSFLLLQSSLFVRYIIVIIQAMQSFMDDQLGRLFANRPKTIDKKDFLPIVQKKRLDNQCSVDILKFLVMSLF